MKKEEDKARQLLDVINDVKKVYEENNNSIPENEVERINSLFSEATVIDKKNTFEAKIVLGVIVIGIILIASFFYINSEEIDGLKEDIHQKTMIINSLNSNNKFLDTYIKEEINNSSKEKEIIKKIILNKDSIFFKFSSKKNTYDSLMLLHSAKNLRLQVQESEIETLKSKLDLIKSAYGIYYSEKGNLYAPTYDSLIVTKYNLQGKLDFLKKYYGISFNDKNFVKAPKVDSALMIYPFYKDKLKYNKEKKHWEIAK